MCGSKSPFKRGDLVIVMPTKDSCAFATKEDDIKQNDDGSMPSFSETEFIGVVLSTVREVNGMTTTDFPYA